MRKVIILIKIIIFIILFYLIFIAPEVEAEKEPDYFIMTCTAYSNHPNCISDEHRDGSTATGVPIREGIVALNVDYINDRWVVVSPLKLGQKIYIEGLGEFGCLDTGKFAERNHTQDMWTLDIYMEDYNEAVEFGRRLKKVYIIGGE